MAERKVSRRVLAAASELARGRPTPFYLFDAVAAAESARRSRSAAREIGRFDVFYPWKCNRHPGLLAAVAREGLGAEVTSPRDLAAALAAGLAGGRIVFQGPAKDPSSLDRALASGAWIVADSAEDAAAILGRARALGGKPRYLLRLRAAACQPEQQGFGMVAAEVVAVARRAVEQRQAAPEGLAFHLGTGLTSVAPYSSALREAAELAKRLGSLGIRVRVLDFGGGFAAAGEARRDTRGRAPKAPPLERFVRRVAAEAARAFPGARLLVEPGRAVASDAFHLVSRVIRVRGKRVYVDASRLSHAFFVPRGKHPFRPIPFRGSRTRRSQIAGPLPVGLDVLSSSEAIGLPREGDLLVIGSVGAYNLIASNEWAGDRAEVVEIEAMARLAGD